MNDKYTDIRNQQVECGKCENLKIYEADTVLIYQVENQTPQIKQKGSLTVRLSDAGTISIFENGVFIGEFCAAENIINESGVPYADNFDDLIIGLSAFLGFNNGGGSGILGAENGTYVAGSKVRLGGNPLIEPTTIDEKDFRFSQVRTSVYQGKNIQLEHSTEKADPFDTTSLGAFRGFSLRSETGNANVGVWSDNSDNAIVGWTVELLDNKSYVYSRPNVTIIENKISGVSVGKWSLVGGNESLTAIKSEEKLSDRKIFSTKIIEQDASGFYYWGDATTNGSFRIGLVGGSFAVQKRIAGIWTTQLSSDSFFLGCWKFITKKSDFPTPISGVISLEDNTTYVITCNIDLTGDRIVAGANTTIIGGSSENSSLSSSGLVGIPLISSAWSLPIRNITITADLAINLDATGNANQAIDWFGVNFTNCGTIGTIKNYNNFIMTDSAFLNSQGLVFDGTIGTIGFLQCIFDVSAGGTMITIPSTATISRRFRINYSSFIALAGETALNISTSASIQTEGYFLDTVNFSGGGTYLVGVQHVDNKAAFTTCRGIENSASISQYYMQNNVTATTIGAIGTFYKAAGSTSNGIYVEKFTNTSNRATYTGALTGYYKVTAVLTLSSVNNNVISGRIAKNGTSSSQSQTSVTTDANGRVENCMVQDIVQLATNDYIEIFIANRTATNNITVEGMTVIIEKVG